MARETSSVFWQRKWHGVHPDESPDDEKIFGVRSCKTANA
jgi:hypothetical protein